MPHLQLRFKQCFKFSASSRSLTISLRQIPIPVIEYDIRLAFRTIFFSQASLGCVVSSEIAKGHNKGEY